jgi:hypothetical protein
MVRLSELLERIRPAGSPGAAAEGDEQHRRSILDAEIADIALTLAGFEQEAERIVATARQEAEQLRRDGERRAERTRAELADRLAVARAAATEPDQVDAEHDAVLEATRHDADRLRRVAEERVPPLVETIVDSIWSMLPRGDQP